jgi:hypothetical protein
MFGALDPGNERTLSRKENDSCQAVQPPPPDQVIAEPEVDEVIVYRDLFLIC